MKNQPADRRVTRTKRMLRKALTELMEEKAFDGITVSDLTDKADINRGTFYLHYRDKYDLLEQNEEEIILAIQRIQEANRICQADIQKLIDHKQAFPFVTKLYEYIQENAAFMKVILGPKGNAGFYAKFKEAMRKGMTDNLQARIDQDKLVVPIDFISAYAISAQLGMIQHWLETGMQQTPKEVSLFVSRLVSNDPNMLFKDED
ncbi:TetR/AcrR family transcriptional regulator [Bacillus testis]|uniref:TetR/AcrR family transcriptional regulator n=1 Tax=Bacillus testis TaxID=1622072 RepID=UPI00067E7E0D|nr:TetR-like C-terminal domain-containing protein [Bacillus testis]